jgi:hypothetical protein
MRQGGFEGQSRAPYIQLHRAQRKRWKLEADEDSPELPFAGPAAPIRLQYFPMAHAVRMKWNSLRLVCAALLILSVTGCNRDGALRGKWVFDRTYTEAQMPREADSKAATKKDGLEDMKAGLVKMLTPMLLDKLDGSSLTITRKEMQMTTRDGSGKVEAYEVIERPEANVWRVKTPDGKIETYRREGDYLGLSASGDVHFMAYFKTAQK